MNNFDTIENIIADIKIGKMVIMLDDEDRENEGDLIMAAEKVRPEDINFMATNGRGIICVPMTGDILDRLELPLMVKNNEDTFHTAWTVSVDAKNNVSTGISSHDRALTIQTLINSKTLPTDIDRPGHIFPLRAQVGGVLVRQGHTEAAIDLARLAGLISAGVICEIANEDGTMSRAPQLFSFAQKHNLRIGTIKSLIEFLKK